MNLDGVLIYTIGHSNENRKGYIAYVTSKAEGSVGEYRFQAKYGSGKIIYFTILVTIQQAYAFTADAVRKHRLNRNKSITEGDFAWICYRNCEGTEQLPILNIIRALNKEGKTVYLYELLDTSQYII